MKCFVTKLQEIVSNNNLPVLVNYNTYTEANFRAGYIDPSGRIYSGGDSAQVIVVPVKEGDVIKYTTYGGMNNQLYADVIAYSSWTSDSVYTIVPNSVVYCDINVYPRILREEKSYTVPAGATFVGITSYCVYSEDQNLGCRVKVPKDEQ